MIAAFGAAAVLGALASLSLNAAPAVDVIDAKRSAVRELEGELTRIDAQAGAAATASADAHRRADALRAQIADTTTQLKEAEKARVVAVERLSERVVALYQNEPPSLVEIVLSSGGIAEAVDAQQALEAIGRSDERIVRSIEDTKARLGRLRASLIDDREEADANVATAESRLAELQGLLAQRRAVLQDAQQALDQALADREAAAQRQARNAAIAAAAEQEEADLRRQADPSTPAAEPEAPASQDPPAQSSTTPSSVPGGPAPEVLQRIAQCESGGNPRAVSASGQYRGKYQFDQGTWEGVGGTGDPAAASEAEQDYRAGLLYARSGPAPWPVCGYR
ncbi:MAG: transglycosylase family protein [Thermoleophilia bacterium]